MSPLNWWRRLRAKLLGGSSDQVGINSSIKSHASPPMDAVKESPFWKLPWNMRRQILDQVLALCSGVTTLLDPEQERLFHVELARRDRTARQEERYQLRSHGSMSFYQAGIAEKEARGGDETSREDEQWARGQTWGWSSPPRKLGSFLESDGRWLFDEKRVKRMYSVRLPKCGHLGYGLFWQCHRSPMDEEYNPGPFSDRPIPGHGLEGWLQSCRQAHIEGIDVLFNPSHIFQIRNPTLLLHLPHFLSESLLSRVTNATITLNLDHEHIKTIRQAKSRRGMYNILASSIPQSLPHLKTLRLGAIFDPPCKWKLNIETVPYADQDITARIIVKPIDGIAAALRHTLQYFVFSVQMSYHYMLTNAELRKFGADPGKGESLAAGEGIARVRAVGKEIDGKDNTWCTLKFGGFSSRSRDEPGKPHALDPGLRYRCWRTEREYMIAAKAPNKEYPYAFWRNVPVVDDDIGKGDAPVIRTGYWVEFPRVVEEVFVDLTPKI